MNSSENSLQGGDANYIVVYVEEELNKDFY